MQMSRFATTLTAIIVILGAVAAGLHRNRQKIEINIASSPFAEGENTAIFAAYTADGAVPDYVISYLRKLKEISPNIVYVADNPLRRGELFKLKHYANRIIAKRHGEYDWGSYKRGFNLLQREGLLEKTPLLIFANDSTMPVAPSLKPVLDKFNLPAAFPAFPRKTDANRRPVSSSAPEFYGITANIDGQFHIQSYFLIFTPEIFQHPDFAAYLNSVKKEKDGLAVAAKYEVPFTAYLQSLGFKAVTYIPYEKMNRLPLNDKNCYPLTLLSQYGDPFLKMRVFTTRLNVQESRRLLFNWLKKNAPEEYAELIAHLKKIKSEYLHEARE